MTLARTETSLLVALVLQTHTMKLAMSPGVTVAVDDGYVCTMTHSCGGGVEALGEGDGLGLGVGLGLGLGLGLSDALADGVVSMAEVLSVVDVPIEVVSLGDVVSLGEVVSVGDVVSLGDVVSVGDVVSLGDVVSAGVAAIWCAVRTTEPVGGDEHVVVAVVVAAVMAARAANPVKIMPAPRKAMATIAPWAAGFRSSALTGCNLASLSRPRTTRVARLRHSTHGLGSDSRCRRLDTKGS